MSCQANYLVNHKIFFFTKFKFYMNMIYEITKKLLKIIAEINYKMSFKQNLLKNQIDLTLLDPRASKNLNFACTFNVFYSKNKNALIFSSQEQR
jgi:hypothetical protein